MRKAVPVGFEKFGASSALSMWVIALLLVLLGDTSTCAQGVWEKHEDLRVKINAITLSAGSLTDSRGYVLGPLKCD